MTALFPPTTGPRVFALPPGADFAQLFLDGLESRMAGQSPLMSARTEIILNTERSRRRLLALIGARPVRLVPKLRVLTEFRAGAADPHAALRRRLDLARAVRQKILAEDAPGDVGAAFDLAGTLETLLAELQEWGVAYDALADLDLGDLAQHWQDSLRFLSILAQYVEAAGPDAAAGRRAAMLAWAAQLTAAPPDAPVLIAGSTGSRGASAEAMRAVAALPSGAVILPGLDPHLPAAVWDLLRDSETAVDHPQWGFARLGLIMGFDPAEVPLWVPEAADQGPRGRLMSLALRPAPVTDQWRREGPDLVPTLAAATADLALIEAPGPRAEAEAIAGVLRAALAAGQTAALITPDRSLARRVATALDRWGINPDDSAGRPLGLTPPGVLIRLVAALDGAETPPALLAAILKHPLTAAGARAGHMAHARSFELEVLRADTPRPTAETLAAWAAADLAPNAPAPRAGEDVDGRGGTVGEGANAAGGSAPVSDTNDSLRDTARP
ncbi:MAG: double-strand break repair protein AddB, partial [Pseudomonadota bacterium]